MKAGSSGLFRLAVAALVLAAGLTIEVQAQSIIVNVAKVSVTHDQRTGVPLIHVTFDARSREAFAQFTIQHVGSVLEVLDEGRIVSEARLLQPITGGAILIMPNSPLDQADVEHLVRRLSSPASSIEIRVAPR